MSSQQKITLPKLGESIVSATIVQWFKNVGESVHLDEPLLEVSTDKVNSEIPSPVSGVLTEIIALPGVEYQVGDVLGGIEVREESLVSTASSPTAGCQEVLSETTDMKDFFSPALLRIARENGIGIESLEKISGTGTGGRLTKKDLESYLERKLPTCPLQKPIGDDIEHVKMSGMRKATAENMVRSFYEAPHASLITEVDVTEVMKVIKREKESFAAKYDTKLTITAFIARALAKALREFPFLNSSLENDTIVLKRFVNLGIAVSVEQGVMVPVVKNCQSMSLAAISQAIADLSTRARANKLTADEVQQGTITLTNFGISGVLIGIPIIRFPEVAIVGAGAIHKKVVPLEDETFGVRSLMHISLTFDHRVLDGMYGCGFLNALKNHLEKDLSL